MGKIYVLSSSDLPNHAIIFEAKEIVNLAIIKKKVGFEDLVIEYEADYNGFPLNEYKGYLGFDESTNDLLSINQADPYEGYINENFNEYKTSISSFIFKISIEDATIKIADSFYNNHSVSKRLSRKINTLIKEKTKQNNDWHEWLSFMKEKAKNEVRKLDDEFWVKFTKDSEVKIKDFYEKNPYIKLKKPTGLEALLMKVKPGDDKKFRQLDKENWENHVKKCYNFFESLIPVDEKLSEIKLPCLFCKTDNLIYKPKFYDVRTVVTIDGVDLDQIGTTISVLEADCKKCESNSQIPIYEWSQMFPKSNLRRWNSIWWLRFRFWGGY